VLVACVLSGSHAPDPVNTRVLLDVKVYSLTFVCSCGPPARALRALVDWGSSCVAHASLMCIATIIGCFGLNGG